MRYLPLVISLCLILSACSNKEDAENTSNQEKKDSVVNKRHGNHDEALMDFDSGAKELNQVSFKNQEFGPSKYVELFKKRQTKATKIQKLGELSYYATYLPKDYMVLNELRKEQISKEEFDKVSETYGDMSYYLLEVETEDGQELARHEMVSPGQYEERIKYLSFEMEKDVSLKLKDGTEVPCVLFHYERTYNVSPKNTFLLGFEVPEAQKNQTVQMVVNDRLFNQGFIKFKWQPQDVDQLPKVKLS